jgi:glyoxylase-like metal-dependent hydrolase (beta-lactamase superfamily II)
MGLKLIIQPVGPLQGNCYIIYDDIGHDCIVIDPGEDAELISGVIDGNHLKIAAILVTHGHADHLGATAEIAAESGAPVYGSNETKTVLADPDKHVLFPGMPEFSPAKVGQVISGGEKLDFDGINVAVHATPGHSPGSLTFFVDDALFCGDLIFQRSVGRTDLPGGSFEQLTASIRELAMQYPDDTIIYPGHGSPTTIGEEKTGNPFLAEIDW